MRACWRCGCGRLAADWDGELRCRSCGRTPPADQTPAAVARLTGLSPRTISRWIDAGLVAASSPHGIGRPRLVDTGGGGDPPRRGAPLRVVRVGDPAGGCPAGQPSHPPMVQRARQGRTRQRDAPARCGSWSQRPPGRAEPLQDGALTARGGAAGRR